MKKKIIAWVSTENFIAVHPGKCLKNFDYPDRGVSFNVAVHDIRSKHLSKYESCRTCGERIWQE